jgi:hypothetical protein
LINHIESRLFCKRTNIARRRGVDIQLSLPVNLALVDLAFGGALSCGPFLTVF